ncbi:hypothetical protein [Eubacterium sp. 1001713B170207_170306_E7]|uniref:hypothetical protein n=1 Tax=Eubacterium sp. 1001713B170207_170306_E7 TaxID=2787097 RepID=UPI001897DBEB|nr:hypothetical protein [Eubacterium sp. 1001713B170207_170306_E7]
MDKKDYECVDRPMKKACIDPERYFGEMMEIIRAGEVIPYPSYAAFTTTPVIELIQSASEEDKVCIARYLFENSHNELEVNNITELPMARIKEIKKRCTG